VLAEDVHAQKPWPPFAHSAMDGYAVRSADFVGAGPWELPLSAHHRTGHVVTPLTAGSVARIFTGAALPPGADAVVMQEDVEADGALVRFQSAPHPGAHVRAQGEDLAPGQLALAQGTRLTGYQLGLLASLDLVEVPVARRPRVSLLCTGDELRSPGGGPAHTLADSNGVALGALVESAGGLVTRCPLVTDELDLMRAAVREASLGCDLLLTVGGVSVGQHDVVRPALESLGANVEFWKVRMKPGKPLLLARLGETLVLGLPGNPASALVTFTLFGMPLVRALQGDSAPDPEPRWARLVAPLRQKPGRRGFYRARLRGGAAGDEVELLENQASGAVTAMAWANCLIVVPEETEHLEAGARVAVLAFADA
jgi:molybdopterin molybdotransferase